jgi:hypothetical protein
LHSSKELYTWISWYNCLHLFMWSFYLPWRTVYEFSRRKTKKSQIYAIIHFIHVFTCFSFNLEENLFSFLSVLYFVFGFFFVCERNSDKMLEKWSDVFCLNKHTFFHCFSSMCSQHEFSTEWSIFNEFSFVYLLFLAIFPKQLFSSLFLYIYNLSKIFQLMKHEKNCHLKIIRIYAFVHHILFVWSKFSLFFSLLSNSLPKNHLTWLLISFVCANLNK